MSERQMYNQPNIVEFIKNKRLVVRTHVESRWGTNKKSTCWKNKQNKTPRKTQNPVDRCNKQRFERDRSECDLCVDLKQRCMARPLETSMVPKVVG